MKLAIPIFQTKISPRFDQTQGFVLIETEGKNVTSKEQFATPGWSVTAKMKQLVNLGIDTLICGGIDRASMQYLSFNSVKIYSWVTGEVDDAVACFLDNRMRPGIILGDQGRMKGRWQFCQGRNHLSNMFQTGFSKSNREVNIMPRGDGTGPKGQGPRSGMGRGNCKAGKGGRGGGGGGRGKGQGQNQGQGRNSKNSGQMIQKQGNTDSGGRNIDKQ